MTNRLPRRNFLGLAATAAGTAMFGVPRRARAAAADYGEFTMGIQTYSLRGFPVDQALEHARDLGVTTLEFFPGHLSPKASQGEIDAVRKKVQSLGLKTLSHGVNPFTADHEANRAMFAFAKRVLESAIYPQTRTRTLLKVLIVWWLNTTFALPSITTARALVTTRSPTFSVPSRGIILRSERAPTWGTLSARARIRCGPSTCWPVACTAFTSRTLPSQRRTPKG